MSRKPWRRTFIFFDMATNSKQPQASRFMTSKEVASEFKISRPSVYAWVQSGALRRMNIPRKRILYVKSASIEDLLNDKCTI